MAGRAKPHVQVKLEADDAGVAAAATASAATEGAAAVGATGATVPSPAHVKQLLSAIRAKGRVSTDDIPSMLKLETAYVHELINYVLRVGDCVVYQGPSGDSVQLELATGAHKLLSAMDHEAKLVYQEIKKFGNKGVWWTKLRSLTGLDSPTVQKIIERLMREKLVKEFRSIQEGKKKMVMLYELTPDSSVDGGPWYDTALKTFDTEFVGKLRNVAYTMLDNRMEEAKSLHKNDPVAAHRHSLLGVDELYTMIQDVKVFTQTLKGNDLILLLDTLVSEGHAMREETPEGVKFRTVRRMRLKTVFSEVPCFMCPVRHRCAPGGIVSPESCPYLDSWSQERERREERMRTDGDKPKKVKVKRSKSSATDGPSTKRPKEG